MQLTVCSKGACIVFVESFRDLGPQNLREYDTGPYNLKKDMIQAPTLVPKTAAKIWYRSLWYVVASLESSF